MKLAEYLFKTKIAQNKLADHLGITPGHLSELVNLRTPPSLRLALAIEKETYGAVTVYDWYVEPSPVSYANPCVCINTEESAKQASDLAYLMSRDYEIQYEYGRVYSITMVAGLWKTCRGISCGSRDCSFERECNLWKDLLSGNNGDIHAELGRRKRVSEDPYDLEIFFTDGYGATMLELLDREYQKRFGFEGVCSR